MQNKSNQKIINSITLLYPCWLTKRIYLHKYTLLTSSMFVYTYTCTHHKRSCNRDKFRHTYCGNGGGRSRYKLSSFYYSGKRPAPHGDRTGYQWICGSSGGVPVMCHRQPKPQPEKGSQWETQLSSPIDVQSVPPWKRTRNVINLS